MKQFFIFKYTHSYVLKDILLVPFCQNASDLSTSFVILTVFLRGKYRQRIAALRSCLMVLCVGADLNKLRLCDLIEYYIEQLTEIVLNILEGVIIFI